MTKKFLFSLVLVVSFTIQGLFAESKSGANLFNLGAPVAASEDNLKNFIEFFPLYIENAQAVALVDYKYVGAIKSREEARDYVTKNFSGPLFTKQELTTEDLALMFLFVEDASADKAALQKGADEYADEFVKDGFSVYAVNYVYNEKTYAYYVFINPETNQVVTEKNMFGFDIMPLHLATIKNLRDASLRSTAIVMGATENAISWFIGKANDNRYGYDQIYRWGELSVNRGWFPSGPGTRWDYDCSSGVITAWQQAGVAVKSGGATYTGNMRSVFLSKGFTDVTGKVSLASGSGMMRGDVLLNTTRHTAMIANPGTICHVRINEKGTATGGNPGDQTGAEFRTQGYYNYPWTHVLRYPGGGTPTFNPYLTLSLSTSTTTKSTLSNSQLVGKVAYLWMTDQTGKQANNGNSTLTSSNSAIVSIDGYGKITFKAPGKVTITAVRNGGINNSGTKDGAKGTLALTSIGLNLSLSTSTTTKNTLSNSQPAGKTVYLWMTDHTGGQANNGNSTLTSSNTNVATIDGYGKIVTKAAGTTTIKAVRNGGINNQGSKDGATGTLTLTVTGTPTLTLSLSSSSTTKTTISNTQPAGKTVYLWMVDSTGANANCGNSTLTSSNTNIATIDGYGKIVTKSAGSTTINAVRNGGINNQGTKDGAKGSLTLTVTGTPTLTLTLSSSSTTKTTISNSQPTGKTIYLWMVDNTGANANCGNSTLTSSNTNIATIDGYGKIVTKSAGSTTIKAVRNGGINNQGLKDGATGTLTLTVTGTPTLTLSLSSSSTVNTPVSNTQAVGKTIYLWMVDNTGGKATNGNSTLTSSNTGVATIDGEGKIITKAGGTTTIKAVRDGGIYNSGNKDNATGTLTLTVQGSGVPTLTLSLSSSATDAISTPTTQPVGKTVYLRMYDSLGNFASNGNSTLSSSNANIATIDGEGKIVTKAAGTTTISAVRDGGIYGQGLKDGATGTLTLTVTGSGGGLKLVVSSVVDDYNKAITSIAAGKTAYLFIQDNASKLWVSRPACALTSSNKNVADISAYGTITAKAAGDVTFTATYNGVSGTVSFKVTAAAAAPTDISTPELDEIKIISTDAGVVVDFDGEALIELYTANGVLVDKAQVTGGYERDLDKGVYILRVNGQTKKFVK